MKLIYFALALFFIVFFTLGVSAETRIAVIDSGLNWDSTIKLCGPEVDLTGSGTIEDDTNHGTRVTKLIVANMPLPVNYCIIPIKIFNKKFFASGEVVAHAVHLALKYKADVINMSFVGYYFSYAEQYQIKFALDQGVKLFIAAGNDSKNLKNKCNAYPACYDKRAVVVGFLSVAATNNKSNYGPIVDFILNGFDLTNSAVGSSFAAPKALAMYYSKPSAFEKAMRN